MNNKGFTLVELLACLALLGIVLGIGLFVTKDTLSTTLTTLTDVSEKEIYDTAEIYVLENNVQWKIADNEYTCITVNNLVEKGYFENDEVVSYKEKLVKLERDVQSKVIDSVRFVDECE